MNNCLNNFDMKTLGGNDVTRFAKLDKPIDRGNLKPFIYKAKVLNIMISIVSYPVDLWIEYDEDGKCANHERSDCFIDPKYLKQL